MNTEINTKSIKNKFQILFYFMYLIVGDKINYVISITTNLKSSFQFKYN